MIVMMIALPAQAHTRTELDLFVEEWAVRADDALSGQLLDEWRDVVDRHQWYFNPAPASQNPNSNSPGWSGSVEQWRGLVVEFFAPGKVETALCLIGHETGWTGDPNSLNRGSGAAGLFQFLRSTWDSVPLSVTGGSYDSGQVFDPVANVRSAAWLQEAAGWSQWSPWNRGECRRRRKDEEEGEESRSVHHRGCE